MSDEQITGTGEGVGVGAEGAAPEGGDSGTGKGAKTGKGATPGQALINEGCTAYGIPKEHVFSSGIGADGKAVIVTNGGAKVRYGKGDQVEKLDYIRVTGINPNAKKKKPLVGKERKGGE